MMLYPGTTCFKDPEIHISQASVFELITSQGTVSLSTRRGTVTGGWPLRPPLRQLLEDASGMAALVDRTAEATGAIRLEVR